MDQAPGKNYHLRIKALRAHLDLTQVALAEALGVPFPTVNRWENGKTKPSQICWARLLELEKSAVYDHMLRQPRLRFLLADDAGADKTI